MDIFFLQLVVLFIPGILWERIDNRCGVNRPQAQFDVIRRAFGFGLSAYGLCYIVLALIDWIWRIRVQHDLVDMRMASLTKDTYTLDPFLLWQTAAVSAASILFAIGWLFISNRKWPIRLMQWIGATKRYGDEDVWDFTFNSRAGSVEYVHVRDLENELNWSGWVDLFSETGRVRELVLRDVEVTNLLGELQYTMPRVYLARPTDSITIEFPYRDQGGSENDAQAAESAVPDDDGRIPEPDTPAR